MQRILVVDDMAIVREPIAAALREAGFETETASGGRKALERLRSKSISLVVLDVTMPDLDGLEVVRIMRQEPAIAGTPVILLTASSERNQIIDAAKLGVRDYLLKTNFATADLLSRVSRCLSKPAVSSALNPCREQPAQANSNIATEALKLSREQTCHRIERAQIKAMPTAVSDLISLICSPRSSISDAARCLKHDPALCMQVLHVANSSAYVSTRARILTIDDAVRQIGLAALRNVATSVGIFETFGSNPADIGMLRIWQHSLAVASLMERFTSHDERIAPGLAYTVALCHELCEILRQQCFPDQVTHLQKLGLAHADLRAHELELFGMPHSDLVKMILKRLMLPEQISSPLYEFLARSNGKVLAGGSALAQLLFIANLIADGSMLENGSDASIRPLFRSECREAFGNTIPTLDLESLRLESAATAAALGGVAVAHLASFNKPSERSPAVRICYLRDKQYAELDPVLEFLRSNCRSVTLLALDAQTVSAGLPNCDALVVAPARGPEAGATMLHVVQQLRACRGAVTPVLYLAWDDSGIEAPLPGVVELCLPASLTAIAACLKNIPAHAASGVAA